jgi:hypothetical protein
MRFEQPEFFTSLDIYMKVYEMLGNYHFRLSSRRFIQELFESVDLGRDSFKRYHRDLAIQARAAAAAASGGRKADLLVRARSGSRSLLTSHERLGKGHGSGDEQGSGKAGGHAYGTSSTGKSAPNAHPKGADEGAKQVGEPVRGLGKKASTLLDLEPRTLVKGGFGAPA